MTLGCRTMFQFYVDRIMQYKLEHLQATFDNAIMLAVSAFDNDQASIGLLEMLGTSLGCEWGTFWKVDSANYRLCPVAIWSLHGIKAPKLERDTRSRRLTISEGNAGHVWRSQKPIWSENIVGDMCIPRSLDAVDAGFRGGIWFAIKTDDTVYGSYTRKLVTA
jgi:hypothetical protein